MAQRRINKRKFLLPAAVAAMLVAAAVYLVYIYGSVNLPSKYEYHFIDVGQGDCTLIMSHEASVVIDTGPSSSAAMTEEYISQFTDKIDILILTHPHEDHIGGADELINDIGVKTVIMPDAASESTAYKKVLDAIDATDTPVVQGKAGETFTAGDIKLELLAPSSDKYEETNNYSIVTRVVTENISLLMAGDAESVSEKEILDRFDASLLKADILKVGHHGSSTSTTKSFLHAVSPRYAVISCAADNSYNHPSKSTVALLEKYSVQICRTDLSGSIVFYSDGNELIKAQ